MPRFLFEPYQVTPRINNKGKYDEVMMFYNFLGFQIIWFGSILYGDAFLPITMLLFALHFAANPKSRESDCRLALLCLFAGFVIDNTLLFFDVMSFPAIGYTAYVVPIWLLSLWVAFGLTLNHSLKMFKNRVALAFLAGAVFGPLSYLAGQKLGAVEMNFEPIVTFIVFAIIWAPLFSGLTHLSLPMVERQRK